MGKKLAKGVIFGLLLIILYQFTFNETTIKNSYSALGFHSMWPPHFSQIFFKKKGLKLLLRLNSVTSSMPQLLLTHNNHIFSCPLSPKYTVAPVTDIFPQIKLKILPTSDFFFESKLKPKNIQSLTTKPHTFPQSQEQNPVFLISVMLLLSSNQFSKSVGKCVKSSSRG